MPDHLRAAFSPTRLGSYLSGADLYSGYTALFEKLFLFFGVVCKISAQERWAEQTPGGDPFVLDFLVLFDQAERTKVKANSPLEIFKR